MLVLFKYENDDELKKYLNMYYYFDKILNYVFYTMES